MIANIYLINNGLAGEESLNDCIICQEILIWSSIGGRWQTFINKQISLIFMKVLLKEASSNINYTQRINFRSYWMHETLNKASFLIITVLLNNYQDDEGLRGKEGKAVLRVCPHNCKHHRDMRFVQISLLLLEDPKFK